MLRNARAKNLSSELSIDIKVQYVMTLFDVVRREILSFQHLTLLLANTR